MKKLLLIQQDEAYFLFETLQTIERYRDIFKDFELNILVNQKSLDQLRDGSTPIPAGIVTDSSMIIEKKFDLSVNLSLSDSSWHLQDLIMSPVKLGMNFVAGQLLVPDNWSSYLLSIKAKAPFLTFHLQDIYKNILGIKKIHTKPPAKNFHFKELVLGLFNTDFASATEQELILQSLASEFPNILIKDISEIDFLSDLSHLIYLGPNTLDAVKLTHAGAKGIFIGRHFEGFNLLPYDEGHLFISTRGKKLLASPIIDLVKSVISEKKIPLQLPYSIYQTDHEHMFGCYLRALNESDDSFPIYQAHVVVWNFILSLFDTNLDITRCTSSQQHLLHSQIETLSKLIRLYDYAMSSVDTIHQQSKKSLYDTSVVQNNMKNLEEIESISEKIAQSNSFLRPFLDYYRIRRGQNEGTNLFEQSQDSFLLYSEEQQCLKALQELFTVTLHKNGASIWGANSGE
jgi:hypothetical protein